MTAKSFVWVVLIVEIMRRNHTVVVSALDKKDWVHVSKHHHDKKDCRDLQVEFRAKILFSP